MTRREAAAVERVAKMLFAIDWELSDKVRDDCWAEEPIAARNKWMKRAQAVIAAYKGESA